MAEDSAADRQRTIDIILQIDDQTAAGLVEGEKSLKAFQDKAARLRYEAQSEYEADTKAFEQHLADERKARQDQELADTKAFHKFLVQEKVKELEQIKAAEAKATAESKRQSDLGVVGRLKEGLGGRSDLKDVFEILRGGGAVAALSLGGQALNDSVKSVIQLRSEFDAGKISAGELSDKLAGSIPIYGQIWQAGRGIRELLTGQQSDIDRINQEHEETNKYLEARVALQKVSRDADEKHLEIVRQLRNETLLLSTPESGRDALAAQFNNTQKLNEANERLKTQLAAIEEKRKAATSAIEPDLANNEELLKNAKSLKGGLVDINSGNVVDPATQVAARVTKLRNQIERINADADAEATRAKAQTEDERRLQIEKGFAEENDLSRKRIEQAVKDEQDFTQRIADLHDSANAAEMETSGRHYEAQIEQLKGARRKAIDELKAAAAEQLDKLDAGDTRGRNRISAGLSSGIDDINSKYRGDFSKLNVDETKRRDDEAKKAVDDQKQLDNEKKQAADRAEQIERNLAKNRIDAAKAEAEIGGKLKETEADRLEIAEQFRQKKVDLLKILQDETSNDSQLEQAEKQLDSLDADQANAERAAKRKRAGAIKYVGTAETDTNAGYLTGVGAAAKENAALRGSDPDAQRWAETKARDEKRNLYLADIHRVVTAPAPDRKGSRF